MQPSEARVFLEALNDSKDDGTDPPEGIAGLPLPRIALLKKRLGAARFEMLCMKYQMMDLKGQLEEAREYIAKQEDHIRRLDGLLLDVYNARSYRLANWLRGRLSALRGLFGPKEGR